MLSEIIAACAGTGFIFIMSTIGASLVLFSGRTRLGGRALLMGFHFLRASFRGYALKIGSMTLLERFE